MKFEKFKHTGVKPNGSKAKGEGVISTNGSLAMSMPEGGCGVEGCNCSPGHWISVLLPRNKNGTCNGIIIRFEDKLEMDLFFAQRSLANL